MPLREAGKRHNLINNKRLRVFWKKDFGVVYSMIIWYYARAEYWKKVELWRLKKRRES